MEIKVMIAEDEYLAQEEYSFYWKMKRILRFFQVLKQEKSC